MNQRTVSLPELVTERKRNSALSLSEGFAGADYCGALAATSQSFGPKPGGSSQHAASGGGASSWSSNLTRVIPIYYRTRQFVLSMEKSRQRVPQRLSVDLHSQERALASELRQVNRLLFQRFNEPQLDRLLRAMPFLKLSSGRWIFGAESLEANWPAAKGERAFLLLQGRVDLFPEPSGGGSKIEVWPGDLFGEKKFRLGDEIFNNASGGAAHCVEACIVALLSSAVIESAYSDRAFGNKRISQMAMTVPAFSRVVKGDGDEDQQPTDHNNSAHSGADQKDKEPQSSGAVFSALQTLSKVATTIHIQPGQEVLSCEPLDKSLLVIARGSLEVRGKITLIERLDAIPPKRIRIKILVEKAEKLAGDSIFDKLDPYCICKLGDFKRFQTPVKWNVGPNPVWEYHGVLMYNEEKTLEFTVMDHDKFSADDLCGNGSIAIKELHDGWKGDVLLTRPKRGLGFANMEEPAGRLFFSVEWEYEKVSQMTRIPKEKAFPDQELFTLKQMECWGQEQLMLGNSFKSMLEAATKDHKYRMKLGDLTVLGSSPKGMDEPVTLWKVPQQRFHEFINRCGRQKQFMQACRVSALEKQGILRELTKRLIRRWENEEEAKMLRGSFDEKPDDDIMDTQTFRQVYQGSEAIITVRNALNLSSGGWGKLDPYAIVRFHGPPQAGNAVKTSPDVGSDPIWNQEGRLIYNGELSLDISVYDHDTRGRDDLIGEGNLEVEVFSGGFEGMVPLAGPSGKKKTNLKQMVIVIGVQWGPPRDPNAATTTNLTNFRTLQATQ